MLKKSMKAHLGRRKPLDDKVIHIKAIRIPPKSLSGKPGIQKLNPMSRARQKSRTKVNLRENCIPRTQLTKSYCQYLSNPESQVETKLTTSVKVVGSNGQKLRRRKTPNLQKRKRSLI